jgi:hypothetical protein
MDIISLIISVIAIAFTVVMYFKHDKRLKKQEERLNVYQLKKIDEEESEKKKAYVRGEIIKEEKGKRVLKIRNTGKTPAKNIDVKFLNNFIEGDPSTEKVFIMNFSNPFELLNINDDFDIIMHLNAYHSTDVLKVKLTWEDDFSNQNEYIQHFKLV